MTRHARHGSASLELLLDEDLLEDTRLSRVLSAARQPTHAEELAGLADARAAFVSTFNPVLDTRNPAARRPAKTRTFAGRLVALKAAAVISGATLAGGVAFAAAQTSLLTNGTHHHAPTTHASQPVAPGGVDLTSSTGSTGGVGVAHRTTAKHPAQGHGNSAANGHSHTSHAPRSHPTHPSTTPPGQSNPPHRKKPPRQHPVHPTQANATPSPSKAG